MTFVLHRGAQPYTRLSSRMDLFASARVDSYSGPVVTKTEQEALNQQENGVSQQIGK